MGCVHTTKDVEKEKRRKKYQFQVRDLPNFYFGILARVALTAIFCDEEEGYESCFGSVKLFIEDADFLRKGHFIGEYGYLGSPSPSL